MKQTAVESIIEKINNVKPTEFCSIETIKKWCIEAKQMEIEQIRRAFCHGEVARDRIDSMEYYLETYGHENK
jgi:hypothetical protein